MVETRSQDQTRSHAQKYLLKQREKERYKTPTISVQEVVYKQQSAFVTEKVDKITQYGEGVIFETSSADSLRMN